MSVSGHRWAHYLYYLDFNGSIPKEKVGPADCYVILFWGVWWAGDPEMVWNAVNHCGNVGNSGGEREIDRVEEND